MFVEAQLILIFIFSLLLTSIFNNKIIKTILSVFLTFFLIFEIISYYLTDELIDYRFFIHTDISSIKVFYFQFKKEILFLIFLIIIINYIIIKVDLKKILSFKKSYYFLLIFVFLSISLPNKSAINKLYEINKIYNKNLFYDISEFNNKKSKEYEDFVKKNNLNYLIINENLESKKNYNILYLTLESIDTGFIESLPELTPNLNKLKKEWNYKKIKNVDGCGWSSGNLYCIMTGLPAYFPFEKNKIFQGLKEIKITSLGDIFKKSQFDFQEYFVGESTFVGTKDLLETMNFNVFDHNKSTGNYKVYPNEFGFHDKDLFFEIKKRIKNLKMKNNSFVIYAATINSHLNGIKDDRMSALIGDNYDNDLEHSVKSLDYLIGDLIKFLKREKLLENTAVFIGPDHLLPNNKSIKETYKKFSDTERSLYLISNKDFPSSITQTQIEIPKIVLDTAKIKHNHKFFFEYNSIENLHEYLNKNKSNFSFFNKSNVNFIEAPKVINISIEDNILNLINDGSKIYELKLENRSLSYVNLLFDKDFIFKNDENPKESISARRISREDEKFRYHHLTVLKNDNKIISAKFINSYDKSIMNFKLDNGLAKFDVKNYKKNNNFTNYLNDKNRFIAHAGGGLNGQKYLNTLESLNKNYSKGLKLFELDLKLTSDGFIVAVHDWENWKKNSNYKGDIPPKLSDFNRVKIFNKYTPLDYQKINSWFDQNKDTILITDKIKNLFAINDQIKIDKSRIFIETFSEESTVKFINSGYKVIANIDFLKLIQNPINFLIENRIKYISVPHIIKDDLKYNFLNYLKSFYKDEFTKRLLENGFKFYAYGLNEKKDKITEIDIICNYRNIFYGMYVDEWDFDKSFKLCENKLN